MLRAGMADTVLVYYNQAWSDACSRPLPHAVPAGHVVIAAWPPASSSLLPTIPAASGDGAMTTKGYLAGVSGTRLYRSQCISTLAGGGGGDKPMIFYPLSTLIWRPPATF